jgi:hypothetical protein
VLTVLTIDWTTVATFATAIGTLVLAVATFAAVRSANKAARVAEAGFRVSLRPVLVTSKLEDPMQKVTWIGDHWSHVGGSQASIEMGEDGNIYLVISLRNVGNGIAVMFGWSFMPELAYSHVPHADPEAFRMQSRDIYIAAGDVGYWQAAIRDTSDPGYPALSKDIKELQPFTIELLYGDHEGGQRTITRFGLAPRRMGDSGELRWIPGTSRHWYLDRPDPR